MEQTTLEDTASAPLPEDWTDRYLALLGISREPPSLPALTRFVRAHVLAVPFENVTALMRRLATPEGPVRQPDLTALLEAWEQQTGGGVCFEIVGMASRLLTELRYECHAVCGQISVPFGHQAIVVTLPEGRFLVDLGNGAPLFAPIPLDGSQEVHKHGLSFRFRPDESPGLWKQDRWIDDAWSPHCTYDLIPATFADRDTGFQHHHTPGASWVLGTLTMVRSTEEDAHSLRDNTLTRHTDAGKEVVYITDPAEYVHVAEEVFGLPGLPIREAVEFRSRLEATRRR